MARVPPFHSLFPRKLNRQCKLIGNDGIIQLRLKQMSRWAEDFSKNLEERMDKENQPVILVVEENDDNRQLVLKVLGCRGYKVVGVVDGQEALTKLTNVNPDLILMDINLPGMDGYEVTRRIRQQEKFTNLPIVALTAHAMVGDEEKSLAAGCNAYITKPINARTFPDSIASILKEYQP